MWRAWDDLGHGMLRGCLYCSHEASGVGHGIQTVWGVEWRGRGDARDGLCPGGTLAGELACFRRLGREVALTAVAHCRQVLAVFLFCTREAFLLAYAVLGGSWQWTQSASFGAFIFFSSVADSFFFWILIAIAAGYW